jgi:peptide/nickel transport system substrate-binding protein
MTHDPIAQHLLTQLAKQAISRREFLGRMSALAISAGALGTALPGHARAAAPKKGGKLTIGGEAAQTKDSLDPTKFFSTSNLLMGYLVYDTLVNRGPDLKPVPWLAESWDIGADASEWIFKLRRGVTFHNGKTFTADDVIYSVSRHIGKTSESPAKAYLGQIQALTKDDDYTVRFKLQGPYADFPIVLSDTRVQITQNGYESFAETAPGTGPFRVKQWRPGSRYLFERNDAYWRTDGPWVDQVEVVGIGDITARVNALIAGDINALIQLDPKAVGALERNERVTVLDAKSSSFLNLALMLDRAPTNNNDVRLALKYAIDREKIVANVRKGKGLVGNDHPLSSVDPYYNEQVAQRRYDPDKARFYIRKAGLENAPIDLYASDVPGAGGIAAAQVLQQSAAAAGVNLNIIQPPADSYWSSVWMQKAICVSGWDGRPVPDLIFSIAFKGGGSYNETKWENPRFDKLLLEARGVTDFAKRKEMYGEMQQMLQDDGGHITLSFLDYLDATRSEVKGITPHSSGPLGFFQGPRTAWIDG